MGTCRSSHPPTIFGTPAVFAVPNAFVFMVEFMKRSLKLGTYSPVGELALRRQRPQY